MSYFDLPTEADKHFPAHGWVTGVAGAKQLRLPILRLYQPGGPTYKHFEKHKLAGMWVQFNSPFRTVRQLAIALRDLHRNVRELHPVVEEEWLDRDPSPERNRAFTVMREGYEQIEISLIAVFVLLRRLADELMNASCPFLFEHWRSGPRKLDKAVSMISDGALAQLKPICDYGVLVNALQDNTGWLYQLRKDKGIRDVLIHREHLLQVGPLGSKPPGNPRFTWAITAHLLVRAEGTMHRVDLFPSLVECLADACKFMERLYTCAAPLDGYDRGDLLFLTGLDDDIVGFWPPIEGGRAELPYVR